MSMIAALSVAAEPLASFSIQGEWWHEDWVEPYSRVFLCMQCGDAWARLVVPQREYRPALTICPCCPSDGIHCPGSMLMWFPLTDQTFVDSLPIEVWQWEIEIHCRHAERGL